MNKIKKLLYAVFILYIFGGVYLYFFQRDFIYYNTKEIKHNESTVIFKIQNETLDEHIRSFEENLRNGERVVVFAHSRGNLFANNALSELTGNYEYFKKYFNSSTWRRE